MILPPSPCAMNWRATAWDRKKTDLRFRFITSSQFFSLKVSASSRRMVPALFTRISTRPISATVLLTMSSMASCLLRSACIAIKRRPKAMTLAAVSSGILRFTPTISHPACASPSVIPWPKPVSHPVTMATFPERLKASSIICTSECRVIVVLEVRIEAVKGKYKLK
ncbi:hypothetical protein D3C80_799530 [compost metagenome]